VLNSIVAATRLKVTGRARDALGAIAIGVKIKVSCI
jgi:hypothetical protein